MNENGQEIINNESNGIQRANVDLTQGIMKVSTIPAETTTVEMVNENRSIIGLRIINNQNLNDGNVSKLMEEHNALVTKESFLCRICYNYDQRDRYSCRESIGLWYNHANHRRIMQSDIMLCSTLTLIVLALLTIVCFGLDYLIPKGHETRFSQQWMNGTTIALLVVSILAYIVFTTFMIRQQLCPSYRWWRSSRMVRVILPKTL